MSKHITLSKPLPYGATPLKELTFRRPMAGDLRGLKLGGLQELDVDLMLTIASRTSVQPVTLAQLYELDPSDFIKVATEVAGFFGDAEESPTTQDAPGQS